MTLTASASLFAAVGILMMIGAAVGAELTVRSDAFDDGERIPDEHTCQGANFSPPIEWTGAPSATRSFVLICDDPDAPGGVWTHWVLFDLPSSTTALAARAGGKHPKIGKQGTQDFGSTEYGGPCPPRGHGIHHYHFRVYALDIATLGLGTGVPRTDVERAMRGHVLAVGETMGTYSRK